MKSKPIKMFIIEDNEVFAMILKTDIENYFTNILSIDIELFKTGEESWDKFKAEKPQVVILDFNLNSNNPDAMNGNEILVWFKRENPKIKAILLTSEDTTDSAVEAFRIGAFDYVVKNENQFKRIHYSLFNIFNLINAENESVIYRNILYGVILSLAVVIGGFAALKFAPMLFGN